MVKAPFPLDQVYRLLEPGPVVLRTTVRNGRPNLIPLSWHPMTDSNRARGVCHQQPELLLCQLAGGA